MTSVVPDPEILWAGKVLLAVAHHSFDLERPSPGEGSCLPWPHSQLTARAVTRTSGLLGQVPSPARLTWSCFRNSQLSGASGRNGWGLSAVGGPHLPCRCPRSPGLVGGHQTGGCSGLMPTSCICTPEQSPWEAPAATRVGDRTLALALVVGCSAQHCHMGVQPPNPCS